MEHKYTNGDVLIRADVGERARAIILRAGFWDMDERAKDEARKASLEKLKAWKGKNVCEFCKSAMDDHAPDCLGG